MSAASRSVPPPVSVSAVPTATSDLLHTRALEVSATARISSRLLLLVGGLTYASWHWVHLFLQRDAIDPLLERVGFLALSILMMVLSYHRALKRHLVAMGYVAVAVGTAHYFSLVSRNGVSTPYLIGVFVVLGGVSALLVSARASITYALFSVALALMVAVMTKHATLESRVELLAGTVTVQIGLGISAWRNMILQGTQRELEKARHELRQLRGLLPICMYCNRIRNQGDQWQQFEAYVEANTAAKFTHALCIDCAEKHYPET